MTKNRNAAHWGTTSLAVLCALAAATPASLSVAFAQTAVDGDGAQRRNAPKPTVSRAKPMSPSSTINLVNLLVQQGVLKEEQAQMLIKQAEDEAYVARQASKDATVKADEAAKAANAAASATAPAGSKRVTYVPEMVKKQLRDDLRKDVMAQAQIEGWASPGKYPEWASRIRFYGDMRGRYESQSYPDGGYNAPGGIENYNAINTGSPYDISAGNIKGPPTYNSDQDRSRFRLRARLGLEADLADGFIAGMRIGTGDSNSPVSTNQTLGGSGGNFSKYALWLDRAFVKYTPWEDVTISGGRFDNPFFAATDLVWYNELGFDGAAIQARHEFWPGFSPFFVMGAFPVFNTDLNFATNEQFKYKSNDKYLLGLQAGYNWRVAPDVETTFGIGYFDFTNVQARFSSPCDLSVQDVCDTDGYRPSFAQKGNTYTYLRNIVQNQANGFGATNQLQYVGLVSQYKPLVASGRVDFGHFNPVHIVVDGEYVINTTFDRELLNSLAINNREGTPDGSIGRYNGGNQGWMTRLTVGHRKLREFGDWSVNVAYKYLESDAVLDAFTDPDFGLGGTNLKGFIVGGSFAWTPSVSTSARWLSATSIGGFPFAVDVVQVDLNAKF